MGATKSEIESTYEVFAVMEAASYISDELLDQLPLILIITDPKGTILKANSLAKSFFKRGAKRLLGQNFPEVVGSTAKDFFEEYFKGGKQQETVATFLEDRCEGQIVSWNIGCTQTYYNSLKEFRVILGNDSTELVKMQTSIAAARVIQNAILPKDVKNPEIEVCTFYKAADDTGGDFYDYIFDEANGRFIAIIGDVNGHGIPAALMTGTIIGAFKGLWAGLQEDNRLIDQKDLLYYLGRSINKSFRMTSLKTKLLASMALVCIDAKSGRVSYLNAGHPLIYKVSDNAVKSLLVGGTLLGFDDEPVLKVIEFNLRDKEFLFLYTDGLIENASSSGKTLSPKDLKKCFSGRQSLISQRDEIINQCKNIWGEEEIQDDIAFMMIRRHGLSNK